MQPSRNVSKKHKNTHLNTNDSDTVTEEYSDVNDTECNDAGDDIMYSFAAGNIFKQQ